MLGRSVGKAALLCSSSSWGKDHLPTPPVENLLLLLVLWDRIILNCNIFEKYFLKWYSPVVLKVSQLTPFPPNCCHPFPPPSYLSLSWEGKFQFHLFLLPSVCLQVPTIPLLFEPIFPPSLMKTLWLISRLPPLDEMPSFLDTLKLLMVPAAPFPKWSICEELLSSVLHQLLAWAGQTPRQELCSTKPSTGIPNLCACN